MNCLLLMDIFWMKYHWESSFAWEGELVWILAIAKTVDTMLGYAKLRLSRPFFWFNQTLPWYYRVMGKTVGMHTESFDHVRPLLMPRALPLVEWIFFVRRTSPPLGFLVFCKFLNISILRFYLSLHSSHSEGLLM